MRYQVPQFIEVESKIFGPFTLKQFIYLAGGGGLVFLLYAFLPLWLVFILGLPVALFAVALVMYKPNDQPFIKVIENSLSYISSAKVYIWKKREEKRKKEAKEGELTEKEIDVYVPKLTKSKLKDLAWSLDIKEKFK